MGAHFWQLKKKQQLLTKKNLNSHNNNYVTNVDFYLT